MPKYENSYKRQVASYVAKYIGLVLPGGDEEELDFAEMIHALPPSERIKVRDLVVEFNRKNKREKYYGLQSLGLNSKGEKVTPWLERDRAKR